jgi:hypothetical protein
MSEHITAREFERWMQHLNEQNKAMALQNTEILHEQRKTNGRVTSLEYNQKNAGKISGKLSAAVSIITTGVIQGALAAFGGKA